MAKIILEPNEQFEHTHTVYSETTLISGKIEFTIDKNKRMLHEGEVIKIPAHKLHIMQNVGDVVAVVDCAHAPPLR